MLQRLLARVVGSSPGTVRDMAWLERIPPAPQPPHRSSLFGSHVATNKLGCPMAFLARPEVPDTVRLDHGVMRGRVPDAVVTKDPQLARKILQNPRNRRARAWSLFAWRAVAYTVPRDLVTYVDYDDPQVEKLRRAYIDGLAEALERHRDEINAHLERWADQVARGRVEVTQATRQLQAEICHLVVLGRWPRNPLWAIGYRLIGHIIRDSRKHVAHMLWPWLDWVPTPYTVSHKVQGVLSRWASQAYYFRYRGDERSLLGRLERQGRLEGDPDFGWKTFTVLVNAVSTIVPFPMVMALSELADKPDVQQRVVDEGLYGAVVKETLRLHPAVTTPARVVTEPAEGASASFEAMASPEGQLFVNVKGVHRHPRGWTRPDEFLIDRWLPGWTAEADPGYHVYMPFGLGVRTCPGAGFAPRILEMFLRAVLQARVVSNPSGQPPQEAEGAVALARYPFVLEFTERSKPTAGTGHTGEKDTRA